MIDLNQTAFWIGTPGNLMPCPNRAGTISVEDSQPQAFETTISGRMLEQHGTHTRRRWSIDIPGARPNERGLLASLRTMPRPWALATIDGWRHNLLLPDTASLADTDKIRSGWTQLNASTDSSLPFLIAPKATFSTPGSTGVGKALCLPGIPVTASAWLTSWDNKADAFIGIRFWDAADNPLGGPTWATVGRPGDMTRAAITRTAPDDAAWAEVCITQAGQYAAPALTWTDGPTDWADGMGCHSCVPVPGSTSLPGGTHGARWDLTFTLQEIG